MSTDRHGGKDLPLMRVRAKLPEIARGTPMRFAAALALGLLVVTPAESEPSSPVADAQRWLALIDAGDYAASWPATGALFRANVTQDNWVSAAGAARKPLGTVGTRKVLREQQSKSLPGVPDGDYDVIQFTTEFANKKEAVETLVLAHEADGWRVDGYFIK